MPDTYLRTWALDGIEISRSYSDGRTVEAYAAIFNAPYEVHDQHGHYNEIIERSAFNRTLSNGNRAICVYNHGMSLQGKPDALASVPLGTPLEIRADQRGLLTITRYNRSALADSVLEAIRAGDIKSQSFRGGIYRSSPTGKVPRVPAGHGLPTVTRHELGLADYGPTPIPVNAEEMVVAVRSMQDLIQDFADLDEAARAELIRALSSATPQDPETTTATSTTEPGTEDPPLWHSGRPVIARARMRLELARMGALRGKAQDGS